ncbi:TPA: stage II sporulation protein M [Staphylococcus aureus]
MYKKTYSMLFFILMIIFLIIGYFYDGNSKSIENPKLLNYHDIFFIFLVNAFVLLLIFALSPTGLSLVFIFKNIFTIGQSIGHSGDDIYIYILISLIHGLFEITALFLAYKITLKFLIYYFKKSERNLKKLISNFKMLLKTYIYYVIPILLIGAVLEVLVSNRLFIIYS